MKTLIKIILLLILVVAIFVGVRTFSGDRGFVVALDQWLDQFQEQESEAEHDDDDSDEDEEEEEDDDDVPSRVEIHEGLPAVRLTEEIMSRSGIQTSSLQVVSHLHEARATGLVVDFQPLLGRRTDYHKAGSDLILAEESLQASARVYERLRVLHKERANVSLRQVEEARFRMTENKARKVSAAQLMQNIRTETMQKWGKELSNWALGSKEAGKEQSSYFDRLLQKQDVLIMVTLPPDLTLPEETSFVFINTHPERSTSRKAYLISPASHTNLLSQGVTYYFRTPAENMRIGMHLSAWVIVSDEVETGVDVPPASVIWYGGQPWVYVQVEDDLYSRRPVADYRETDFGWFITDTFEQDEKIVIRGGQLLLSEELRWQIPDEDDD